MDSKKEADRKDILGGGRKVMGDGSYSIFFITHSWSLSWQNETVASGVTVL